MPLNLLVEAGARADKETKYAPIFINRAFTGLWTQRNPLRDPSDTIRERFYGGRPDALLGGTNIELTNRLTLARRPGCSAWSSYTVAQEPLAFYSFQSLGIGGSPGTIDVIMDTPNAVYNPTPAAIGSPILNKSAGAGQTTFLGVGSTLYMGDGVDLQAWQNGTTRNWGINIGLFSNAVGPNTAGAGADGGGPYSNPWTNPGGITGTGSFATSTVVLAAVSGATFRNTNYLDATSFSFSVPPEETISGVEVNFNTSYVVNSGSVGNVFMNAQLLVNGSAVGNVKQIQITTTPTTYTLGSGADLWGTTLSATNVNTTGFGLMLWGQVQNIIHTAGSATISVNDGQITLSGTGGPTVTPTGSGSMVGYKGYAYVVSYGNSASGHVSSTTPSSANTGPFGAGINTSTLGASGLGYAAGDTGFVNAGNFNATYTVNTVNGSGAVLTYTISAAGTGYSVANNVGTLAGGSQPGGGTGFSINVTAITGVSYVGVDVVASTDPQVNQIWVFRTTDGGATFLNLPNSPFPNTTTTIHDSATDAELSVTQEAPIDGVNNPPPAGALDPVMHQGRVWVHVGASVYASGGPDTTVGNGNESFSADDVFVFPSQVTRKIATATGLLVYTTTDLFIIGGGPVFTSYYSLPFVTGLGLNGYNAITVEGTTNYLFTADNQFLALDPSSGVTDLGFPIGDQLAILGQTSSVYGPYVTSHISGYDKAIYVADGVTGWFRCNPNQPPDGGQVWSPKANVVNGAGAVQSIQTSTGVHQLLIGGASGGSPILFRDLTSFSDNGSAYAANFTMGSLILAQPGQLAELSFVTCDFVRTGTSPTVSFLLDEISGTFTALSPAIPDPTQFPASTSIYNNRYYFQANSSPAWCRFMQIQVDYGSSDTVQNEMLDLTVYGAHWVE